jgi:DNA polymerase elongation subunit (family B)
MGKNREVREFLSRNKGYLKWGSKKLAKLLGTTPEVIKEVRDTLKGSYQFYNGGDFNKPGNKFKRLFFDIETSYNIGKFWSAGWNKTINPVDIIKERAVICVSWKWEGEDKVYNIHWDENQCDKTLLETFSKVLLEADEAIAHNGDRFDITWLRTRCLLHRVPFPTYIKTLDTLRKVKSMFNFQSNKLDYIASFLGFGHKLPTGMQLWDRIILNRDAEALREMIEYCDHDVVLLEDVYHAIETYIKPNTHVGRHNGKGKDSCPTCGSSHTKLIKNTFTAAGTIKRHMGCDTCGTDYIISNTAYKKRNR